MRAHMKAASTAVAALCAAAAAFAAPAKPEAVAVFDAGDVTYSFFSDARLQSVREKASGRELVVPENQWLRVKTADGKALYPVSLRRDGDRLVFSFRDGGEVVESVKPFDGGLSFTVEKCTFTDATEVVIAYLKSAVTKYLGDIASAYSDDESGICMRSGEYEAEMFAQRNQLFVSVPGRFPVVGKRAFVAAGPRSTFVGKLKNMVLATGLAYSRAGGPWSADPDVVHRSYLFSAVTAANVDRWIRAAKLSGMSIVHLYTWEETRGHYGIRKSGFPGGLADLKATADKIHAAGLSFSLHTLTGYIDCNDEWVTPKAHPDLIALHSYTLAEPLTDASTEVVVNEEPGPKHGTALNPGINAKVLDIGGELVSYKDVRREKPYAFTGIERGLHKTAKSDHPRGAQVRFLQSRNASFFPEPDSKLAVELADSLAGVINATGADMFYLDGSEAMGTPYGVAKMAAMIFSRVDNSKRTVPVEMSCHQKHFWPFRAQFEAWDRCSYGVKSFIDNHIESNRRGGLKANFLKSQMGWWSPTAADLQRRGFFLDEVEYFASRTAGFDSAFSLQGVYPDAFGVLPVAAAKALAVIGRYERFRVAGAFAPEVMKRMDNAGSEGRLAQNAKGEWTYTPVKVVSSRLKGAGVGGRGAFRSPKATDASLRVEMFYNLEPYDSAAGVPMVNASMLGSLSQKSADKVTLKAKAGKDPERGDVISLRAYNDSDTPRGAWTCLSRWERPKYMSFPSAAGIGLWVKGDGSGAVLDVRVSTPMEYYHCDADHLVKLDFKGWKYVELLFRERDTEQASRLAWDVPYDRAPFMVKMHPERVAGISVWLNEIPVSQPQGVLDANAEDRMARPPSVDIAIGEIRALPIKTAEAEDVSVKVNGSRVEVPFDFDSGDYAELEDGVWSLYKESGDLKKRKEGPRLKVAEGLNEFRLKGSAEGVSSFRGEVVFIVKGGTRPALRPLTPAMKASVDYEVEMPTEWAPSRGATEIPPVHVRPGEKARLEITLRGPIADPVLSVQDGDGWTEVKLPSVAKKRLVVFKDGPVVSGVRRLKLASSDPTGADAVIEVAKQYVK